MRPLRVLAGVALFALLAGSADAVELSEDGESETQDAKERAKSLVDDGNNAFEHKRFERALSSYQEAYDAYPSAKILFNIAETHGAMGHLETALKVYQRCLEEGDVENGSEVDIAVRAATKEIKARCGYVAAQSKVEGAEIAIDGVSAGRLPRGPICTSPGAHELTVEMIGYEPFRADVRTERGKTTVLEVALTPRSLQPGEVDPDLVATEEIEHRTGGTDLLSRWWFWTAVGAVAVAAVTVGIVARASNGSDGDFFDGELGKSKTSDWMRF